MNAASTMATGTIGTPTYRSTNVTASGKNQLMRPPRPDATPAPIPPSIGERYDRAGTVTQENR